MKRSAWLAETPEIARKARALEQRVRLIQRGSPPIARETPLEPRTRESPHLVRREHRATRDTAIRAPSIHMLFRPEE